MEKESHVKLIKELTTWAKDLRSTLQEVEKTKEMDRTNYRRQLESLKQDQGRELVEARSQLAEARSQLTEARFQLEKARSQLANSLETKEVKELMLTEQEKLGQNEGRCGETIQV